MKLDWWWIVVAFAVAWFLSRQQEQNAVAANEAQRYRDMHPIDSTFIEPPAVGISLSAKLDALGKSVPMFKGTIIA